MITGEDLHIGKLSLDGGKLHCGRPGWYSCPTRTTGPAGRLFSRPVRIGYWKPGLPQLLVFGHPFCWACAPATAVRPAGPSPPSPPPGRVCWTAFCLLTGTAVFLFLLRGQTDSCGLCGAGSAVRGGAVFRPVLRAAAARMGLLGGHTGVFGPAFVLPMVGQKIFAKNCPFAEKSSFIFQRKCLYNLRKNRWRPSPFRKGGADMAKKIARQRKSAHPPCRPPDKLLLLVLLRAFSLQLYVSRTGGGRPGGKGLLAAQWRSNAGNTTPWPRHRGRRHPGENGGDRPE